MTSSQQPPRDDSADTPAQAPLSLAELTRAALAAQKDAAAGYQPR